MTRTETIREKLKRVRTGTKFAAILAYMTEGDWITPAIVDMAITSDGFLLAGIEGDCGLNVFIGDVADLDGNIRGIAPVAGLTDIETAWLLTHPRITDHRD